MFSSQQLQETNNSIKQCHSKLTAYHKLDPLKKLQFLSSIWNPHHLVKPTRYTPAIIHLHLKAPQLADSTIPSQPPSTSLPSLLTNHNQHQLQHLQRSRKDTVEYQEQLVQESQLCFEFLELHIFWLQASVDLFLQRDIGTQVSKNPKSTQSSQPTDEPQQQFTSTQLLYRLYDQIIRYLSAPPYTQSDLTKTPNYSPSCVQYIPYSYLQDILIDFFTSPAFLASFDLLLPTYRSTLLTPPSQSDKKFHNIYTLLYSLCYDDKHLFSSQTLTQITGAVLTAFPTLLTGFIYFATHYGVDITTIGQLLIDVYLVRGYKQQALQEQQHIDLSIEQLFQRWTAIVLQAAISKSSPVVDKITQTPRRQRCEKPGQSGSKVLDKFEMYSRVSKDWSHLMSVRHNVLRSVLDLYSIDQIADKIMRKQQYLTKKKQFEFSERIKNQFGVDDPTDDFHNPHNRVDLQGNMLDMEYPGSSASSSEVVLDGFGHIESISQHKYSDNTPTANNKNSTRVSPHKTPDQPAHFALDISDNDSRGGDFDDLDDDFDHDADTKDVDLDLLSGALTPKHSIEKKKTFTTPQKSQNNPNARANQAQMNSFHLERDDSIILHQPSPKLPPVTLNTTPTKPTFPVVQCDDYDIDEAKTFREMDNTTFYKSTAFPRYTNSQTYLLQLTAQKPDLHYDIQNMVQEFDSFQVSIAIDEDGNTMVTILPPRRHKVIEMNEDDYEYIQQQRIQYQKEQFRKKQDRLLASGQYTPQQLAAMSHAHNDQTNIDGMDGVSFDTFSDTHSYDQTTHKRLQGSLFGGSQIKLGSSGVLPLGGAGGGGGGGESMSIFSGRSGITLGGNVSSAMKSVMLSSITSTNTMKSLLAPASLHRFANPSQSPTQSFGFLASPTPLGGTSITSPQPPQSPTNASKLTSSARTGQPFLSQHTPSRQPESSQSTLQSAFISSMQLFHKNRLTRKYNTFIHPQQQQLISLFESQNERQNTISVDSSGENTMLQSPWSLLPIEGEGLSEYNPLETHFFTLVIKLLPLYPILITFSNGFYPYVASFHQLSVYSNWSKLLFFLFGQRLGRREFVLDFNGGTISQHIKNKQYSRVNSLFREEVLLLSQMLFLVGKVLHNILLSYDDKYPTLNLGWIYAENGLIDPTSNEFHDENQYPSIVNPALVVSYAGYIHSIRSLYSLLKYTMIKLKQILHCVGFIQQNQLQDHVIAFNQSVSNTNTIIHNEKNDGEIQTLITPHTPHHPQLSSILSMIQSNSLLSTTRGEIEEILFQCYYLYQRHFAFSALSLPTKGVAFAHHQKIALKLTPTTHSYHQYKINKAQDPDAPLHIPLPPIDWTTCNAETSARSTLLLFPQNNIISIQLQLHKQLQLSPPQHVSQQSSQSPTIVMPTKSAKSPLPGLTSSITASSTTPASTQNDTTPLSPSTTTAQVTRSIQITPELERKILATDHILSHIFPHYIPDPQQHLRQLEVQRQNEANQSLPLHPPQKPQHWLQKGLTQPQTPPKSPKPFTTYCVNRLWIDFDLLYDCYSLSRLLKIDLLFIDNDKKKLFQTAPKPFPDLLAPSLDRREFNLELDCVDNIVLYYLDIFNTTTLLTDFDAPISNFHIDCDGVVTPAPLTENDLLATRCKPTIAGNVDEDDEDDENGEDEDVEFSDDIRNTPDPVSRPPNRSRIYDDYDSSPHPRVKNTDRNTHSVASFRYDPESSLDSNSNDAMKPQLRHTQSQIHSTRLSSGGNSTVKHDIATTPATDLDLVIIVPDKLQRRGSSESDLSDAGTLSNPQASSPKSQAELDLENNTLFCAIQRGEADLMLFEYLKPPTVSTLYQYLVEDYYTKTGVSPTIVHKYSSSAIEPVASYLEPQITSQSPQSTQSTPQPDPSKKKRWFRF